MKAEARLPPAAWNKMLAAPWSMMATSGFVGILMSPEAMGHVAINALRIVVALVVVIYLNRRKETLPLAATAVQFALQIALLAPEFMSNDLPLRLIIAVPAIALFGRSLTRVLLGR
jgi:hypothetical protein